MIGFIRNSSSTIYSTFWGSECSNCMKNCLGLQNILCPIDGHKCKQDFQEAHGFECFLCLNEKEAKNKSIFIERFQIFLSTIPLLVQSHKAARDLAIRQEREKYYKIVHNLKHLNAEALGVQYTFIPQELLTENYSDLFTFVKDEIQKDIKGATLLILKQAKINAHIKTEFDTHELLSMDNPVLDKRTHKVRQVILNVYHPFERDFKQKNCSLIFDPNIGYAHFDYRTMRLAFAHILSNAAKYVKPSTDIFVEFVKTEVSVIITFSMTSLFIKREEVNLVFNDGFSGEIPKAHNLSGSGLGMGLIRKAVSLNNGIFSIIPGSSCIRARNGLSYAENKFVITLPLN